MKKIASRFWRAMPRLLRRTVIRATQTNFTVSASAVVFDSAGRVLLLDHVLRAVGASWDIVGGYLSADEQPAEALRREAREEAGITIKNLRLIDFYTSGHHVEIVYRAKIDAGEACAGSREIVEAKWFAPGEELPPAIGDWNDDTYFTSLVQAYWQRPSIKPPTVVVVSYGPVWLLTPQNSKEESGLMDDFVARLPEIESKGRRATA